MSLTARMAAVAAALAIASPPLLAADDADLKQLRQEIDALRQNYEARIAALESRLRQAESGPAAAPAIAALPAPLPAAPAAPAPVVATVVAPVQSDAPVAANGFNPAIALILSGTYASLSQDPAHYRIPGFLTGGEVGPGTQGFSLGESELSLSANIDPWFYGAMNLSLAADNTASVEEAYVQTTALPAGLSLRMGRYLAGIGYLNDRHPHTWDFVDAPLAYQVFLGGQLQQDGVQWKALMPTDQFIELGGGLGASGPYPSGGENRRQPGTATLFAHGGGDVGVSHSWRAGLSLLWARAEGRASDDIDGAGNPVTHVFSGDSRLAIVDGVWKWAPNGNPQRSNLTLQGEYFRRIESGELSDDSGASALTGDYRSTQSGWYAQAVYQFMPAWRIGARYDRLDVGNVEANGNNGSLYLPDYNPTRATLMLDWSPSEFSRVRLQVANDRARFGATDNQFYIQYQMSLGSHGAHTY